MCLLSLAVVKSLLWVLVALDPLPLVIKAWVAISSIRTFPVSLVIKLVLASMSAAVIV
ncbi:hypothetical protein BDV93DRAFT_527857 [Ceratobasidium sp. AG-I]|nr:hypothetical protein BDV93DRAFT_527857 [Ceratobasidium sp. AG-I]